MGYKDKNYLGDYYFYFIGLASHEFGAQLTITDMSSYLLSEM